MALIIYIHGFKSSGESEKSKQLKAAFPDDTVVAPDFSPNPAEAVKQLHALIAKHLEPTIIVGTSLGGFYATYLAVMYDVSAFIINPALEPHVSLIDKVGNYKRYGNGADYNFESPYLDELKKMFDTMHSTTKRASNLHFYLSSDDDVVNFDKLDDLFPNRKHVKVLNNAGHRFSRFTEIFPDIQAVLNKFKK